MLARLQRALVIGLVLVAAAWFAWHASAGRMAWAVAGAAAILFAHALVLGLQFVLLAIVGRADPAPRARIGQLVNVWAHEGRQCTSVFGCRQPFRAGALPDTAIDADPAMRGRRGVVFIHGYVCNRGLWTPWFARLRARGVPYASVDLEPVFGSIDLHVPLVEAAVAQVERATGLPPLLVCHSMGGLVARAWLRWNAAQGSSDSRVHHVVTIGTPHAGTWLARWSNTSNGRQMRLASAWQADLSAHESAPRRARFTCYYSHCDNIVFPPSTAALPGAHAVHVEGCAHLQLAFVPQVVDETLTLLDQAPASVPA
jgi:triacylglycerol lipase